MGLVRIGDGRKYAREVIHEQWCVDTASRAEDRALEAGAMLFGPEDVIVFRAILAPAPNAYEMQINEMGCPGAR